jgi:hypothetical protein
MSQAIMWMEAQYWHVKTLKVLMGMSGDLVIEVTPSPLLDSQFLHTENNGYPTHLKDLQDLIILLKKPCLKHLSTLKY